jgi:hypothetical protein
VLVSYELLGVGDGLVYDLGVGVGLVYDLGVGVGLVYDLGVGVAYGLCDGFSYLVLAGDFSGVVVVDSFLLAQELMSPAAKRTVIE